MNIKVINIKDNYLTVFKYLTSKEIKDFLNIKSKNQKYVTIDKNL